MFLVVGLGNPGRQYEHNRHNVGFMALDSIQRHAGFSDFKPKFSGVWTRGEIAGQPAVLLKPQTYMNTSRETAFSPPLHS